VLKLLANKANNVGLGEAEIEQKPLNDHCFGLSDFLLPGFIVVVLLTVGVGCQIISVCLL